MIKKQFSPDYIKEKLDENDQHVNEAIEVLSEYKEVRTIALLRGIILHNLAISKELGLITEDEYLSRYSKWQDNMHSYWYGTTQDDEQLYNAMKETIGNDIEIEKSEEIKYEKEKLDILKNLAYSPARNEQIKKQEKLIRFLEEVE